MMSVFKVVNKLRDANSWMTKLNKYCEDRILSNLFQMFNGILVQISEYILI